VLIEYINRSSGTGRCLVADRWRARAVGYSSIFPFRFVVQAPAAGEIDVINRYFLVWPTGQAVALAQPQNLRRLLLFAIDWNISQGPVRPGLGLLLLFREGR
jgi:hypothetical protein